MEAYLLVNTEKAKLWEVANSCKRIQGIKMTHAVTGQFDVVIYAEFAKMEDLGRIINEIQNLEGVVRTQTLTAVPQPIRQ